jgi:hypothetical protein
MTIKEYHTDEHGQVDYDKLNEALDAKEEEEYEYERIERGT